jgi:GntR family transcriptional regulator
MFDRLDSRSPVPLYEQIATRVRVAVASGELSPGDALPSVRQVAGRARINPATVVQAYRELEADGFVEMRQGAGTFIQEVLPEKRSKERSRQVRALVQRMMGEAARLGLDTEEIVAAIRHELEVGSE